MVTHVPPTASVLATVPVWREPRCSSLSRRLPSPSTIETGGGRMHRMHGRVGLTIVTVALAIVAVACSSDGGTGDKAGGPGEPVVLQMGTGNGDLDFTPQIGYLVDRVAQ